MKIKIDVEEFGRKLLCNQKIMDDALRIFFKKIAAKAIKRIFLKLKARSFHLGDPRNLERGSQWR